MSDAELVEQLRCWEGYDAGGALDLEGLVANVRALLAEERERCARLAESFCGWSPCVCDECRGQSQSCGVDTPASMATLAAEIRRGDQP